MATSRKPAHSTFDFALKLPRGYQPADALRFHGRDKEALSERVTASSIHKAILLDDVPTLFDLVFDAGGKTASCTVSVDGKTSTAMPALALEITMGLLGLRLDPLHFARFVVDDPILGPLTKKQKGLRIVQAASIFEALTWAVMGQQINVSFAVSLRRTFIALGGRHHSSGLVCYPSPADAVAIPLEALTSRQFSRSKAETILRLAGLMASGELDLDIRPDNPIEQICQTLLAIKGIGPWTVNYALLRGYGHADCSLHGDVAVRAAIGNLWGHAERPDIAAAEALLKQYSPHRTMAAAHLWASLQKQSDF